MHVQVNHCIGYIFGVFARLELGTVAASRWVTLQVHLHTNPAVVFLQLGNLLWQGEIQISLLELAYDG